MVLYQKGEVRAFEVLLSRHRKPVYNFILRIVGDKETAEYLLQEAFMRVIKGAEAYKRQAKFTTWLYTIARNLCVDQTRRRKHRKHASLDAPMDTSEESGTLMDVIPGNEMASDRKSVNKQLHETMQHLAGAVDDDRVLVTSTACTNGGNFGVLSTEIFFSVVGAQLDPGRAAGASASRLVSSVPSEPERAASVSRCSAAFVASSSRSARSRSSLASWLARTAALSTRSTSIGSSSSTG